jgi:hypothetical protein
VSALIFGIAGRSRARLSKLVSIGIEPSPSLLAAQSPGITLDILTC